MRSGAVLFAFAVLGGACARSSEPRSVRSDACVAVDVLHHDVHLKVGLDPPSLAGRGTVRVRARHEASAIALDAHHLVVTRAGGLRFAHTGDRLCVRLPQTIPAGSETTVELEWSVPTSRETPHFAKDHVWAGYRASAWMPTRQDPAQSATLSLAITAPAGTRVAASGRSVGAGAFVLDRPSPPFLYAFAAGRFDEAEIDEGGVKLRALGPPGADLKGALEITRPMLRFLRDRTGTDFPAPQYTQVFVDGDAAQEAAGMSLLAASALDDVKREPTEDWIFAHELAHQWFAWLVPCADFADFWLNEGFATFMVAAVKEARWGRAAYDREVTLWRKRSAKVQVDAPLSLPYSPAESNLQPRGIIYSRGALVLHALRTVLGDPVFWDGVRRYVKDRAGKGARAENLRRAMESASGKDLRAFFAKSVYAPAPDL